MCLSVFSRPGQLQPGGAPMRVAAILLSTALLLPASLPAQMTCSDFLEQPEAVRTTYVTGLLAGFATATNKAQEAANRLDPDSSGIESFSYLVEKDLNPDVDPESLRRAVEERGEAQQNGARLVAAFLRSQLTNADTTMTNQEVALRMAAKCSRSENAPKNFGLIFWEVLKESGG